MAPEVQVRIDGTSLQWSIPQTEATGEVRSPMFDM